MCGIDAGQVPGQCADGPEWQISCVQRGQWHGEPRPLCCPPPPPLLSSWERVGCAVLACANKRETAAHFVISHVHMSCAQKVLSASHACIWIHNGCTSCWAMSLVHLPLNLTARTYDPISASHMYYVYDCPPPPPALHPPSGSVLCAIARDRIHVHCSRNLTISN